MGCHIIAIDSGSKKEVCERLGADHFVDFTTTSNLAEAVKDILAQFNVPKSIVLALVGSHEAYQEGMKMLGHGGTFVCVGLRESSDAPKIRQTGLKQSSFETFRDSHHTS